MTSLALADTDPAELAVDALVLGMYTSNSGTADGGVLIAPGAESVAAAFDGKLAETLGRLGATGTAGEVVKLATFGTVSAPVVAAVGLGKLNTTTGVPTSETLRRAAGAAVRALAGADTVAIALPVDADSDPAVAPPGGLRALAEGALLGGYRFAGYKSKPRLGERKPARKVTILVPDARDRTARAELRRAAALVEAVGITRDWVNTAPNDLRPPQFADAVVAAAARAGLDVEVLDERALRRGRYGGLLAVGSGSAAPPRLVRLAYRPKGRPPGRHVALVGKGVTFDSGGVSIKPAQGMWEMKSDMAGAAAVAGAMIVFASLKPKIAVTAFLPMAENMPSGTSYRPGDVVTMYGGKRVEVLNTDAEGRMILGDAIARAAEEEPDYLVETSTLTGGQVVALGNRVCGVMGTDALCERIAEAGERVGEAIWPMPLPDDVRKAMESDVADISQVHHSMDRAGHMLQGGVFLAEFVPDGMPWAHIDIAGPSYTSGEAFGYLPKGATGIPLRTLVELVEDIARDG